MTTIERDIEATAQWLYETYTTNRVAGWDDLSEPDPDEPEGGERRGKAPWLAEARELCASNRVDQGTISVHYAATGYAGVAKVNILREFGAELTQVTSFSDLHSHCDANAFLEHVPMDDQEAGLALTNAVTDILDEWIREKQYLTSVQILGAIRNVCEEASLPVMMQIYEILYARDEITPVQIYNLTPEQVQTDYDTYIGPAIDKISDDIEPISG